MPDVYIREFAEEQNLPVPPIACFTATAKTDVIGEILSFFQTELKQYLRIFQGGIERENLIFEVQHVSPAKKFERIYTILEENFLEDKKGSVVIYAATRKRTVETKDYLAQKGVDAEVFHAGLDAQLKRRVLDDFVSGNVPVICATNAFGMGIDKEDVRYKVRLHRSWAALEETAQRRRKVAHVMLNLLLEKAEKNLPKEEIRPGGDLLVSFSSNELTDAIKRDMELGAQIKDALAVMDRGLMFLHEHKVITMQQGLAIFRQAMTIQLAPEAKRRRYSKMDYQPLSLHYKEKVFQVHVMSEYAQLGLQVMKKALGLILDYFSMGKLKFIDKYFSDRKDMLERATSLESYQRIVEQLANDVQMSVVTGPMEKNMLDFSWAGIRKNQSSGASLRVFDKIQRVRPDRILMLCFNHNAALTLRRRLNDLVGQDAQWVTVLTYHALAMRLTGKSIAECAEKNVTENINFEEIIRDAIALLRGRNRNPGTGSR